MNDERISKYFEWSQEKLEQSAREKIHKLKTSEKMIDSLPPDQLRSWLRFLLHEYFRLSHDNERLIELLPDKLKPKGK